jgi:uncharacterized membrane protein
MRIGLVIVGVILLIVGAVLLFVPVVPQSNETVSSSSSTPYYEASVSGYSISGSIPISVTWTSSGPAVEVAAGACSSGCTNPSQVSSLTFQNGTSGSFTLNQPNGGSIVMGEIYSGSSAVNVTFKITTALSTVGTILVPVGILILIVGAVLKGKGAKMAAAPAPTPAEPSSTPPPPPA